MAVLSLVVLTLVFTTSLLGQISSSTGAIQGTVSDPQNASIPGAKVTLTHVDPGTSTDTTTLSDGTFLFPLLAPGNYKIHVLASGFETSELDGVRVDVTKVTNANVKLTLGQVSTVATVQEDFAAVDTRTATTGDVIIGTQIRDIPLPTRNFLDLTAMQAGTAARIQSAATVGRGSPILDVAGSRATVNNFVLDGIDARNFGSNSLAGVSVPSPDAVAEFRVSTSMYDASQGRGSGGNINVVLRSGTDHFHGGAFGQTIGNWGLSGVWTIQSGLPFSITSTNGGGLAGLNGSATIRANAGACSTIKPSGSPEQNLNNYMNAACFAAVPNLPAGTVLSGYNAQEGAGSNTYVIGNNGVAGDSGVGSLFGGLGRNILRGPGAERLDLAVTKTFPVRKLLGEGGKIMFRAEAFKLFNNPIFSNPQANISNSNFGHIISTVDGTGRIPQLALKLNF